MSALSVALVLQLAAQPACTVPGMVPSFWPGVVKVESHYDPLALHDDATGRSYYPDSAEASEALATRLMAQGHSVGVGLSQLTARSPEEFWAKFGLSVRDALDACQNMQVGARFYVARALSIYNSGSPTKGLAYAQRVVAGSVPADTPPVSSATSTIPVTINRHGSDTEVWQ